MVLEHAGQQYLHKLNGTCGSYHMHISMLLKTISSLYIKVENYTKVNETEIKVEATKYTKYLSLQNIKLQ